MGAPSNSNGHIFVPYPINGRIFVPVPSKARCTTSPRTRCLAQGGFKYNSDSYADDLPYWNTSFGKPMLIIPYTLDNNDMRFAQALEGDRFFNYLKVTGLGSRVKGLGSGVHELGFGV